MEKQQILSRFKSVEPYASVRLLRQRPFGCLSQPVTTPESKFTKCRVSKSVFEERSKIANSGIVGDEYTVFTKEIAKARPSPVNVSDGTTSRAYGNGQITYSCALRTSAWKVSACPRLPYFFATTGTGRARVRGFT